jgi:hypothetical protein
VVAEVGQVRKCSLCKELHVVYNKGLLGSANTFEMEVESEQIYGSAPSLHLFKVTADFMKLDWTILHPLPIDADVPEMTNHLETLQGVAGLVLQWEDRLCNFPDARLPALVLLHEVKETMEAELAQIFGNLREECSTLTPERQEYVFGFASDLQNLDDFRLRIPDVDKADGVQLKRHLEVLKSLARYLFACEDRFHS